MAIPKKWMDKANRSLFFFIALLFHLILFLLVATWVIFQAPVPPPDDFAKTFVPSAPPPPPPPQTTTPTMAVSPTAVPTTPTAITSPSAMDSFNVPMPQIDATVDPSMKPQTKIIPPSTNNLPSRLQAIRTTVQSWRSPDNIRNAGGDVHNLVAKFPVYLARYADGDWNCNNYYMDKTTLWGASPDQQGDTVQMLAGCLPNIVAKVSEWSRKDLTAEIPKWIAIDSPELITTPPPYIFFTGHKDFHLTDAEVTNLRKYLQIGGAIWGDSAFAGDGSRFDVAFHREMKRVLPDKDKNFEVLPMDHEIFTKSWFPIDKMPLGMNYRCDPVEIINLDGKLAVIYTPNDYSDMMTLVLAPGREEDEAAYASTPRSPAFPYMTPGEFPGHPTFYRNYTPAAAMAVDKLSMNILAHLLIRFDDDLLLTP